MAFLCTSEGSGIVEMEALILQKAADFWSVSESSLYFML